MKKLTCPAVGGPEACTHVFEVETFDDLVGKAEVHAGEAHPELVADMTPEKKEGWKKSAQETFDAAPDA